MKRILLSSLLLCSLLQCCPETWQQEFEDWLLRYDSILQQQLAKARAQIENLSQQLKQDELLRMQIDARRIAIQQTLADRRAGLRQFRYIWYRQMFRPRL